VCLTAQTLGYGPCSLELGLAIRVAVSTHLVGVSTHRVSVSTRLTNLVKDVSLMRHNYVINGLMDHKRVINVS
jgi:hypothetical protein